MRWSIVRLIWARELRDQLRDRRTLFMIAVLPLLLYPLAGYGVLRLTAGYLVQQNTIGVLGAQHLPPWPPREETCGVLSAAALVQPPLPALGVPLTGLDRAVAATAASLRSHYPPLFLPDGDRLRIPTDYFQNPLEAQTLTVRAVEGPTPTTDTPDFLKEVDRQILDDRQVDLLLVVPADFMDRLRSNQRAMLYVLTRSGDDRARVVDGRMTAVLLYWRKWLKDTRLLREGLSPDFDEPLAVYDPERTKPSDKRAAEGMFDMLVKVFPFVLVLWSLAGALYPAVDLCAGEKERGIMETLLISPASREEIVWGKFLTIWVFSAATALLNLLSMGITTWQFSQAMPLGTFRPTVLLWGVLLLLPLSAFFSAVSLAVGAYARSSKEGQYYLMPLFLATMPLVFLTLAPGVELNAFYSMVPVTGVALLLQRLMAVGLVGQHLWGYFLPVLAPIVIYSWLALRWAIEQFQREEVLFREAERLELGLWLKRLWREKEALPSSGEALFCFALILGLQWLSFGLGGADALPHRNLSRYLSLSTVRYLAFVATPPLFMALLLTTRPLRGLGLSTPAWWSWPAAALLALLMLPPVLALTEVILNLNPRLREDILATGGDAALVQDEVRLRLASASRWTVLLVMGVLPALCEELAFRGFILSGLRRRFRPWTAILVSSFLFALYQMNVFQFVPHFVVGTVLALLASRTGSLGPAVLFHLVWNLVLLAPILYPGVFGEIENVSWTAVGVALGCAALAAPLLWVTWQHGPRREKAAEAHSFPG